MTTTQQALEELVAAIRAAGLARRDYAGVLMATIDAESALASDPESDAQRDATQRRVVELEAEVKRWTAAFNGALEWLDDQQASNDGPRPHRQNLYRRAYEKISLLRPAEAPPSQPPEPAKTIGPTDPATGVRVDATAQPAPLPGGKGPDYVTRKELAALLRDDADGLLQQCADYYTKGQHTTAFDLLMKWFETLADKLEGHNGDRWVPDHQRRFPARDIVDSVRGTFKCSECGAESHLAGVVENHLNGCSRLRK